MPEDLSRLIAPKQPPPMVKGEVDELDGTDLYVVVPEYDPQLRFGPCEWIGPASPARGDLCLVLFDDEREPWVIVPGTF